MNHKLIPLIISAAFFVPSAAFSLGIRLTDQDAAATARGNAFTATADDPSAVYYNPAGITQLQGINVSTGFYGIYFQDKVTFPNGDAIRTKDDPQVVPQMFITAPLKDTPLTIGLGVYSPFGLGIAYPDNSPTRTLGLIGSIKFIATNPVLAWKINDQFSIAAGVTANYITAELERGVTPMPGNFFKFAGTGYSAGFNLGAMYKPNEQNSFGITYHSETLTELRGHSTFNSPAPAFIPSYVDTATARFQFPQIITAGYSYRPTSDWNFEADIDWADWHQLKTVTLNQDNGLAPVSVPFNWLSSFMFELGATRYLADHYHVSAGYMFAGNSTPSDQNFSPLVPDSNHHVFSVGFGQKKGSVSWDIAYQLTYGPPRSINNGTIADGEYRFLSHAITLTFGYHF